MSEYKNIPSWIGELHIDPSDPRVILKSTGELLCVADFDYDAKVLLEQLNKYNSLIKENEELEKYRKTSLLRALEKAKKVIKEMTIEGLICLSYFMIMPVIDRLVPTDID